MGHRVLITCNLFTTLCGFLDVSEKWWDFLIGCFSFDFGCAFLLKRCVKVSVVEKYSQVVWVVIIWGDYARQYPIILDVIGYHQCFKHDLLDPCGMNHTAFRGRYHWWHGIFVYCSSFVQVYVAMISWQIGVFLTEGCWVAKWLFHVPSLKLT